LTKPSGPLEHWQDLPKLLGHSTELSAIQQVVFQRYRRVTSASAPTAMSSLTITPVPPTTSRSSQAGQGARARRLATFLSRKPHT
jgi:hypothetical protein